MDFRLFLNVLRRFRLIVGIGFVLACALAFFSFVKIGSNGLEYRQQVKWMSTARVLVTSTNDNPVQLAITYAALATSDEVTNAAIHKHGIAGTLQADFGYINRTSIALPTVLVSAISATPANSAILANDGIVALERFVARQQAELGVPPAKRAELQQLNRALPSAAQVATPRSKTLPVVVFVLIMAATVGLAFMLENLRPRVRAVPAELGLRPASDEARRVSRQT